MRFTLVRSLKGDEILGKVVTDSSGNILLMPGTKLNRLYINKLKEYGIFSLYVQDEKLEDIKQDETAHELKQTALKMLPGIFYSLASGSKELLYDSYHTIKDLVDYIIEQKDIQINLYEINKYDNYTYIHSIDTSIMATLLGLNFHLNKTELRELAEASMLHDIGKTKIRDSIINKKGKLTPEEFLEIKKHPLYGFKILKDAGIKNEAVLSGVAHHHEKVDGTGYPFGIKGDKLSLYSKIISICDVFTALSAKRSYRDRFNPNEAYEYILGHSGTSFDSEVVKTFKEVFSIYPLGSCVKLSNGIEGFIIKQNKNFPDRPFLRVTYDHITRQSIPYYEIDLLSKIDLTIVSMVIKKKNRELNQLYRISSLFFHSCNYNQHHTYSSNYIPNTYH